MLKKLSFGIAILALATVFGGAPGAATAKACKTDPCMVHMQDAQQD